MTDYPYDSRPTVLPPVQQEQQEDVPGVILNNYSRRVPSEDGTYVTVTTHTERIVKIPQPPTPEELEAQKKADRNGMIVVGVVVTGFFALIGWLGYQDEKNYRTDSKERLARSQATLDTLGDETDG